MVYSIFTIYDEKSESYSPPFFMATKGLAIRAFTETANGGETSIAKHPEDFTLYDLGDWDDQNGLFHQPDNPKPIIKAIETKEIHE